MLFPEVSFEQGHLWLANNLLTDWQHQMGPCNRPYAQCIQAHFLKHEGQPIGLTVTAPLVRQNVAKHPDLTRDNTIELARVCASRSDVCRVLLRLWRLFVFEPSKYSHAISYQDANLHTGNLYRFDGWKCIAKSSSGTDTRSGRKGRKKKVWHWGPEVSYAP